MGKSYYRWVIVAIGGLLGCVAIGAMFSLPVFLRPISRDTGWSVTGISSAMTYGFLAMAGTDKTKLLSANIWITDMAHFGEMNTVWDAWVSPGNTPARATVEAKLASPDYKVEIMVVAAR